MRSTTLNRLTLGFAAAAMSVALIGTANATPIAAYSLDNGSTFTSIALTPAGTIGGDAVYNFTGNFGSFGISGQIGTDYPGLPGKAQVISSAVTLVNNTSDIANIIFAFSDGGYAAPSAPPQLVLNSHIGGTVSIGSPSNTMSFLSCVTPNTGAGVTSCAAGTSTPAGTPDITNPALSYNNDQYAFFDALQGPYAITELLNLQLGGNAQIGFQANSTLSYVPEPGTVALMLVGLLGLTFAYRRRQA